MRERKGTGQGNGNGLPKRARSRGGHLARAVPSSPPPPAPAPPSLPVAPAVSPSREFRALQEEMRLGIWEYAQEINYNPWQRMMHLALEAEDIYIQLACHREIAQYLLPKLKAIEVQGQVTHTHTYDEELVALLTALEQEEEAERATLPPWTPPVMDLEQGAGGVWQDVEEDEEGEEEGED